MKRDNKKHVFLKIILVIVALIILYTVLMFISSAIASARNISYIKTLAPIEYDNQLVPTTVNGYESFVTDGDFRIMQVTDIHIGNSIFTLKSDKKALEAMYSMLKTEKPDLLVATGDIAFLLPSSLSIINGASAHEIFSSFMEQTGVYYAVTLGNHDSEVLFGGTRALVGKGYEDDKYQHCLFSSGPEDVDGIGNYTINILDTSGKIRRSLIMLDSNMYTKGTVSGLGGNYDNVHESQIEWYSDTIDGLTSLNKNITPPSSLFLHIPPCEYRDAWYEYYDNGFKDTENVQLIQNGEYLGISEKHCCPEYDDDLFETVIKRESTDGIFCGHDHINNITLKYKGVYLTYAMTIDFLVYADEVGYPHGCTVITVDGSDNTEISHESFYDEKYGCENKEALPMERETPVR